ncbi:hypothetical protein BGZ76_003757 [Entomortierella beljakovae]|nr:hypothetical protein BGZ76_003757 [Entomortierella beljakovae]
MPSFSVGLKQGCGADFLISIGLTLLGHIPGIGYAWYVVYKYRDDPDNHRQHRHGHAYVAVPQNHNHNHDQQHLHPHQQPIYQATPTTQHPVN